jgi:hypothetical protein
MKNGVNRAGDRPIVYVGVGSHANYFVPGRFAHLECASEEGPCFGDSDTARGDKCVLAPPDYELVPLTGTAFPGGYGAANYLGPRNIVTGAGPDDPRGKPAFDDPESAFSEAERDTEPGRDPPAAPRC